MSTTKKIILFVLVMNSLALYSFSHQDSLTRQFEQTPRAENDDFKKALLIVYEMSDYGYHDKAQELGNILLDEATQSQSLPRQALSYFLLAYDYKQNSEFDEALAYYKKSLAIREQMDDSFNIAKVYSNMSNIYYDIGNYSEALSCQKKSLSIRLKLNDQVGIARSLGIIGNILCDQKQYQESISYYRKSLNLSLKQNDSLHLSNVLVSMGHVKHYLNEDDSAHYYYNRSLSYSLPGNKYSACYAYRGKGTVYTKNKQFDKAKYFTKKSLALAEELNAPLEIILSQLELAQFYLAAGKNLESIALLNQTLTISREINFTKGIMKSNELLSQLYEKTNDYEQALKHYRQYKILSDSLSRLEEKRVINDLQTQIKIDEEAYQLKTVHTAQKNKLLLLSVILVFFILVLLIYFYYRAAAARKEFNLSLKRVEFKAQEQLMSNIHDERKRISQDVHDDLGASITGVQIFTEMIADRTTNPELKKDIDKLLFMQKEITSKVREVIWFIKNEDNLLENLIKYCKNYGENLFNNYPITISIVFPKKMSDIKISEKDRKHFFLSYKEVLNNIIKHSKADKVFIQFEIKNSMFSIQIKDNGKGFNIQNTSSFSYGLKNIKSRMQSIRGRIEIESNQNGTLVKFEKDYSDLSD